MRIFDKITFAALMGVGALALMGGSASARTVCNEDGDCWHATTDYDYQPAFGLTIHQTTGNGRRARSMPWREHEGKGYWKGGSWKEF